LLLLREKYCVVREVCVVRSSSRCEDQPCKWVHREGREEEKERDICKLRLQLELYAFI
jgi:hypothetical protein